MDGEEGESGHLGVSRCRTPLNAKSFSIVHGNKSYNSLFLSLLLKFVIR